MHYGPRCTRLRGPAGLLVLLAACGGGGEPDSFRAASLALEEVAALPSAVPGAGAPAVGAEDSAQAFARLSEDAPVLVNLWATWCPPCMAELPDFAAVARRRRDVVFIGLSGDWTFYAGDRPLAEDVARIEERWTGLGMPFPTVYCTSESLEEIAEALDLPDAVFPQTLLYAGGRRVAHHHGEMSAEELEELLEERFGELEAPAQGGDPD